MNVTRVILAKNHKFPSMTAWEFEERLELEAQASRLADIQLAWKEYLESGEHEIFVEYLRNILSDEYKDRVCSDILKEWSGE